MTEGFLYLIRTKGNYPALTGSKTPTEGSFTLC
jgi:hypothetical protein